MKGKLAKEYCGLSLDIIVMSSPAGYYIGTGNEEYGPVSRESLEYFSTEKECETALRNGSWTQRDEP